jgi:hypothetical protein
MGTEPRHNVLKKPSSDALALVLWKYCKHQDLSGARIPTAKADNTPTMRAHPAAQHACLECCSSGGWSYAKGREPLFRDRILPRTCSDPEEVFNVGSLSLPDDQLHRCLYRIMVVGLDAAGQERARLTTELQGRTRTRRKPDEFSESCPRVRPLQAIVRPRGRNSPTWQLGI